MKTRRLKKALMLAVLAAAASLSVQAQDTSTPTPPPPPPRTRGAEMQQRQLERMTQMLNLTPEQVGQVKAIQADALQQMMALESDGSDAGPDRRARMLAVREGEQTRIKAVLTDQQKLKFDAMLEKMKERRQKQDTPPSSLPPA